MRRFRYVILGAVLAGFLPGCGGEEQPNAPAGEGVAGTPDFAKTSSADMLKANTGMGKGAPTAPPGKK